MLQMNHDREGAVQAVSKSYTHTSFHFPYFSESAEQSAVDKVETSKPVLKMALCSSFTDSTVQKK